MDILKKHVHRVADYPHYDNIIFRDGNGLYVVVVVDGKEVYKQSLTKPRFKEWYINTFFDGYTYRESCYNCQYACSERISDITIGDFWGLGKKYPTTDIPDHKYGCSLVLPISKKGHSIVKHISDNLNIYERPLEEAISGNKQLQYPSRKKTRIKLFRKLFPVIGFKKLRRSLR